MADTLTDAQIAAQAAPDSLTDADIAGHQDKTTGWLDAIGRFGQGFYDKTLKGVVDTAGAAGNAVMHPGQTAAAIANSPIVQHPLDTVAQAAKQSYDTHTTMLEQARQSAANGNYDDAIERGTNALIPILGPSIQASSDKMKSGDVAGGMGELAGDIASLAAMAPGVSEAVASKLGGVVEALGLPKVAKGAATKLYQSALKPSQVNPEKAAAAVQTGLASAIPVSEKGQTKLASLLSDLSGKAKDVIASDPNAQIDTGAVAKRLQDAKQRFTNQALPQSDVDVIDRAHQEWLARNGSKPATPGTAPQPTGVLGPNGQPIMGSGTPGTPAVGPQPLSAQAAQEMKQGTYQQLKSKAYGEMKTAQVESEKALARGLKEELETKFPELKSLNAEQTKLYGLDPYLDKAVARIGNHNLVSLGDMAAGAAGEVAGGPVGMAGAAIMRHIVGSPEAKSKLAILLNKAAGGGAGTMAASTAKVASYVQSLDDALFSPASATVMPGAPMALPMAASGNQQNQ